MMGLDINTILIIVGVVCIIAEILLGAATGFDLLLVGLIFVAGGGAGMFLDNTSVSLVVIIVLCFLYITVARSFIKNKLTITTKKTNTDSLLGKKGVVVKKITPAHAGQVKVEGEIWRASSNESLDVDTTVVIQSVSGVTLTVSS